MSGTVGMSRESRKFYARLLEMISEKRRENYAFIASWIRRKISFALANSPCTCLGGSRSVYYTSNISQRIRCLHFQRLAKLRQMLMQLYYPFEFHILHTTLVTTATNILMPKI